MNSFGIKKNLILKFKSIIYLLFCTCCHKMASQRFFFTIFNSYFNFSTYIGQKNMIIVKCLIEHDIKKI